MRIISFVLLILISRIWAQTPPQNGNSTQALPKSPNVEAMERHGTFEVDLYRGLPQISIPIYEIKTKNFTIPLALSYHASGIKVSDVASWVGLGWSLSGGAYVGRNVRGLPDDQTGGFITRNYYLRQPSQINPTTSDGYYYLRWTYEGFEDAEPDIFSYNLLGAFGHFLYKDHVSSPITVPYEPLVKIERYPNVGSYQFKITGIDGNKYFLGDYTTGDYESSITQTGGNSRSHVSAWLISKMTSADNTENITYEYYPTSDVSLQYDIDDYIVLNDSYAPDVMAGSSPVPSFNKYEGTTNITNKASQKLLNRITFDNGKIEFVLGAQNRQDLSSKYLEKVNIYEKNKTGYTLIRVVKFSYGYFTGLNNSSKLKLNSVEISSANEAEKQVYKFTYNETEPLPATNTKAKDFWGYYNGKNYNQTSIPGLTVAYPRGPYPSVYESQIGGSIDSRSSDPEKAQVGILKRIQYPTGGYSLFLYEPNYYERTFEKLVGGGVRIKSILTYDHNSTQPLVKTYKYGRSEGDESGVGYLNSISPAVFEPDITHVDYSVQDGIRIFPAYSFESRVYSSQPKLDNKSFDETNVYYPFVTEYLGTILNNTGKITYIYSHVSDQIFTAIFNKNRYVNTKYWQRGKLLHKKEYEKLASGTYNLKKHTYNQYNLYNEQTYNNVGMLVAEVARREGVFNEMHELGVYGYMLPYQYQFYNINTGMYKLAGSTETEYVSNGQTLTTITNYNYNLYGQVAQITSNNSKQETLSTLYKYPLDYNFSGTVINNALAINNLISLNKLSTPVEVLQGIQKPGSELKIIKGSLRIYNAATTLPKNEYILETTSPISNFQQSFVNASGDLTIASNYKKAITYDQYDDKNNLLEYTDERGGLKFANTWGYNKTLITSNFKSAGNAQVAFTSFEDNDKGGWTYQETSVQSNTADAASGTYVYAFNGTNPITKNGIPAGQYKISYWSKLACTVNGGAPSLTSNPNLAGLKLYEHQIILTTAGSIAITSTSNKIDNLILQPLNSEGKTYSYLPLTGLINETQVSNFFQNYEYDGLQKLKYIKDYDNNIVKKFEFAYIGNSVTLPAAPTVYWNNNAPAITIRRNNCPANYNGEKITYIVLPGNHYSLISQNDADQSAVSDLNINAQEFANNKGICIPANEVKWIPISQYCQQKTITYPNLPTSGFNISVESEPNTTNYTKVTVNRSGSQYRVKINYRINFTYVGQIDGSIVLEVGQDTKQATIGLAPYTNEYRNGATILSVERLSDTYLTGWKVYSRRAKLVGGDIVLVEPNTTTGGQGPYFSPTEGSIYECVAAIDNNIDAGIDLGIPSYANLPYSASFSTRCGSIEYKVPAGKHTSTISQNDANQQAQNDINTNGQAYANTQATCPIVYYNVKKSGNFRKSDCTSGTGTLVTYTVPEKSYSSIISQDKADEMAQNDVTNNGPAYANSNGTCLLPCSYTPTAGTTFQASGITNNGTTVSFYVVFKRSTIISPGSSVIIASINGGCIPSATRTVSFTTGGRTWNISIFNSGQMSLQLASGSAALPAGTTVGTPTLSYTK